MFVPLTAAAAVLGLGLVLAVGPARAAPPESSTGSSPSATPGESIPSHHADSEWKALLAEMQAEGLIAIRKVGWGVPPSPASAERPGDGGPARDPSSPLSPKGVREPPCPSP